MSLAYDLCAPPTYGHVERIDHTCSWRAKEYFVLLKRDNLITKAFPDGSIQTEYDFVSMAYDVKNRLYLVFWEGEYAAHLNLNGIHGKVAAVHFSFLKAFRGPVTREISIFVTRHLFATGDYKSLIGVIPRKNRAVFKLMKDIGWTTLAILPEALRLADGSYTDAILSVLFPEDIPYAP